MPSNTNLPSDLLSARHLPLTLEHVNLHLRLIVSCRRKYLRFRCWYSGISFNHRSFVTPPMVSTPKVKGVTSKSRISFTSPMKTLHLELLPQSLLPHRDLPLYVVPFQKTLLLFLDLGHPGLTANQYYFTNCTRLHFRVF
jgi:hypothetical protein